MLLSILREIASNIQNGIYYTIMTNEVTDASNDEQFVLCLRSVDYGLVPHEDLIGLYKVPNICACTFVLCIRDAFIHMNLSMNKCRAQCYGGARQERKLEYRLKLSQRNQVQSLLTAMAIPFN